MERGFALPRDLREGDTTRLPSEIAATVALIERALAECAPSEVAEIVGQLERLKFLAWNRRPPRIEGLPSQQAEDQDRYLTIGEVAARLRLSKSYCYELARRGRLPVTALANGERSIRVKLSELATWEAGLRKNPVDDGLSTMLSSRRDGNRVQAASGEAQDDAGAARGAARRSSNHTVAVGTRSGPRPGSRRPTSGASDSGRAENGS
jgi:excisionase family DNA binding protein